MSGRAGRRGLDDRGIVILMIDEKMSPGVGKNILQVRPGVRAIGTTTEGTELTVPLFSNTKNEREREREREKKKKRKRKEEKGWKNNSVVSIVPLIC